MFDRLGAMMAKTLEVINPYDGSVVDTVQETGEAEVRAAIGRAAAVAETMATMTAQRRAAILTKAAEMIDGEAIEIARTMAKESGKPMKYARGEVSRCVETFTFAADAARSLHGETIPLDAAKTGAGKIGYYVRIPVGVIAGITPFNFPLNLVAHKLAPAMAVGCPVVLKPAPQTPLSALKLAELIFDSGWPAAALSVLPMENDVAAKLVSDDRLKVLSFTGSAKVGWELKSKAGKTKVLRELGGNAAVVIEPDTDVAHAAARCVAGGFGYSGQSCISVQRIFVHRDIFSSFCDHLLSGVQQLKCGDPLDPVTDCGPLIRESDAVRVESWINEAVAAGAKLLCGGKRVGAFVKPAVLTATRPEDKVQAEEIFGPAVVVEEYLDFGDALARVNQSHYGLQAGVFTHDERKLDLAFNELEVGGVIANDVPTFRSDAMPYGGVKDSGLGREGVRFAMAEMSEMRLLVQ
jgi:glyceraldehyde-3-phosphate dehydrogenase (NADP+)